MNEVIHRTTLGSQADVDRRIAVLRGARSTQRIQNAVAPEASLTVLRAGTEIILQPGAEVLLTDAVAGTAVAVALHELIEREAVIHLSDAELAANTTSSTVRFVVARGGSVSSVSRGILPEGAEITVADFETATENVGHGQALLGDLVRRGAVIDRQAPPTAPKGARA